MKLIWKIIGTLIVLVGIISILDSVGIINLGLGTKVGSVTASPTMSGIASTFDYSAPSTPIVKKTPMNYTKKTTTQGINQSILDVYNERLICSYMEENNITKYVKDGYICIDKDKCTCF